MPDDDTTTGTSGEPGTSGGVPEGYVPQASFDALEQKRREMQSTIDKMKSQLDARPEPVTPAEHASQGREEDRIAALEARFSAFDPKALADDFTARFNQQQQLLAARTKASSEFGSARPEVLGGTFETAEELLAAAKASHEAETTYRSQIENETREKIAKELREKHGHDILPAPQAPAADGEGKGQEKSGPQTIEDLARLTTHDFLNLPDDQLQAALSRTA